MIIGVGVVLRRPDGAILLGRRVYAHETPSWCLPGGKVDPGESFEVAARRETFEETGIRLKGALHEICLILGTLNRAPCLTAAFVQDVPSDLEAQTCEPAKIGEWGWFTTLPSPLFGPSQNVLDVLHGNAATGATVYRFSRIR